MAEIVKFKQGQKIDLPQSAENGAFYIATEPNNASASMYVGVGGKMLPIQDGRDSIQAVEVEFTDGQNFQQKLDNGSLKGQDGNPGVATQTTQPSDPAIKVWVNPEGRTLNLMTESDLVGLATKDEVATVDERVTALSDRIDNLKPDTSGLVKKTELLNLIYPIGSIYMNIAEINPNSSLGGTWEKIAQGKTLFGDDSSTYKAGQSKEAGLPNITGRFDNIYGEASNSNRDYTGCCINDSNKGHKSGWSSAWQNGTWGIDASKSNPIYGKSETVQPPALVVCIWKRTA